MFKIGNFLLAAVLALSVCAPAARAADIPSPPTLYSGAAVLMDADTGQVLYGKRMHEAMYPASTTKLMTLLLAMEEGNPRDLVTVNDECVETVPRSTTHIALTQGEQLTLEQLEYAMMVESANDAANAIAIHLAGDLASFAKKMNARAKALDALDTHFTNANGLPDDNHFTSAYDLALITKAGYAYPQFRSLAGTQRYQIPPTNKQPETRNLNNRQYMFCLNDTYPGAFAGKTGWTEEAGHTLVTLAERDGVTLICVVLYAKGVIDAEFKDSTALLDYGFDNFRRVTVPRSFVPAQTLPHPTDGDPQATAIASPTGDMPVLLPEAVPAGDLAYKLDATGERVILSAPASAAAFMDTTVGVFPMKLELPAAMPVEEEPVEDSKWDSGPFWRVARTVLVWAGALLLFAVIALLLLRQYLLYQYHKRVRRKNQAYQKIIRRPPPEAADVIDLTGGRERKGPSGREEP